MRTPTRPTRTTTSARSSRVHAEAEDLLGTIDEEDRVLITGHDAFAFTGAGLRHRGSRPTDYISTEAQLSPQELSDLADLIVENEVPVIFQDNQANPQAITSLREAVEARGWEVKISDEELYADTLGARRTSTPTWRSTSTTPAPVANTLGQGQEEGQ